MNPNQLPEDAKQVHLLASEKSAMKARILESSHTKLIPASIPSPFLSFTYIARMSVTAFALFIVVGTSLTYAAQGSTPGDTLYAFELGVIEPIEEVFQRTPEKQVAYHTDRLEERLAELKQARKVSREPASYVTFNTQVAEHANKLEVALEREADTQKKVEALVEVSALMQANEDLLEDLNSETDTFDASEKEVRAVLTKATDTYGAEEDENNIRETLLEDLRDTSIASTTDEATVSELQDILTEIEDQIEEGEIREAFKRITEVRVEIRKQLLLGEEEE